ncbi:hypothetical protein B0T40_10425 [Chromobacterium haemolyticum]|uniref:hypothetical protein n=1 Tax=Chromobacterium haemolyticum TaxID=394935 RepID=UPI0009DA5100|nr:hypothetical protein [Chromobacterium haemolyticum]OQS36794.1 hypothetical protein B0T40_10425 [Chromobacterium haemolyticum]
MKERPILFSGEMIRALLAGTKTQTRRVCKSQPYSNGINFIGNDFLCHNDYLPPSAMLMDIRRGRVEYTTSDLEGWEVECPYGQPGDRLWVREAWAYGIHALSAERDEDGPFVYAADGTTQGRLCDRWRPSIHMPRAACRLVLEITDIRVERLQDITFADAQAEGWPSTVDGNPNPYDPITWFKLLWVELYGAGSWDANPYVWQISFKKVEA